MNIAALFDASAFFPTATLPSCSLAKYQYDIWVLRPVPATAVDWSNDMGLLERSWMRIKYPAVHPGAIVALPMKRKFVACVGPMSVT
ncbi:MAG: hypothetical protein M5U16_04170 [Hyphomicrobium sp.]|nr:hypothetical protein [Hyphomicrobium sp.]